MSTEAVQCPRTINRRSARMSAARPGFLATSPSLGRGFKDRFSWCVSGITCFALKSQFAVMDDAHDRFARLTDGERRVTGAASSQGVWAGRSVP